MTIIESQISASATQFAEDQGKVSYDILDHSLWRRFRGAEDPQAYVESWLALQCRAIPGTLAGQIVLGEPEVGPFLPAAHWPDLDTVGNRLSFVLDRAVTQRNGAVAIAEGGEREGGVSAFAAPIIVEGGLYGACAILAPADRRGAGEIMRRLQWGVGWIEVLLRRQMQEGLQEQGERNAAAFDMLATMLEHQRVKPAATALVTALALRLDCDPVSLGIVRRGRCRVIAISHAASFGKRMSLIRDVEVAMNEAVDQKAIVLHPHPEGWDYRVSRAHSDLAHAHKAGSVLTLPLQSHGAIVGAITLERRQGVAFDEPDVELCDAVAAVIGPVLAEKRRNDRNILVKIGESFVTQLKRLLGPGYFGRKLATIAAVALTYFLASATGQYVVTSPAILEGSIQRTIIAPFNGYVASERARAGSIVKQGEVLAQLDDQDLVLERLRLDTARQQRVTERNRALADRKRAEAMIILAQIEQAKAQIALIDEQLSRTRLVAPFDGVVVQGDLSQSIGASVQRGQELFRIAPLDSYRVVIEVDESDIEEIEAGQTGSLRLASIPEVPLTYTVERITAISEQKEGRNFFRVEGALAEGGDQIRPGMEGVAKTEIDERLVFRIYAGKMIDWARLAIWRWMPERGNG